MGRTASSMLGQRGCHGEAWTLNPKQHPVRNVGLGFAPMSWQGGDARLVAGRAKLLQRQHAEDEGRLILEGVERRAEAVRYCHAGRQVVRGSEELVEAGFVVDQRARVKAARLAREQRMALARAGLTPSV